MDRWIQQSLTDAYIRRVSSSEWENPPTKEGLLGIVSLNPWYDEGVVFDWTALHSRLTQEDCASTPGFVGNKVKQQKTAENIPSREEDFHTGKSQKEELCSSTSKATTFGGLDISEGIDALNEYGLQQLASFGEEHCVITVLEIDAPWKLQPLEKRASLLSSSLQLLWWRRAMTTGRRRITRIPTRAVIGCQGWRL